MESKEENLNPHKVSTKSLPKDDFEQLQVNKLWKTYLRELKKSGNFVVFNALNHVKVEVKENFELLFSVTSNVAQEEFNKQRNEINRKFKDGLNNHFIQLKTEVVEIKSGKVLYSPKEKYEYLVKKNPNLERLRKNLDLDIYG